MKNKDRVKQILKGAIKEADSCQLCVTCAYSYFRRDSYDGYCKFELPSHGLIIPKHIGVFDVCQHWKKKEDK